MSNLINITASNIPEGEIFNKYLYNRMIRRNQNCLVAITGPTGSGKSYISLKVAELWYQYHFKEDFPIEHCCFSIGEVMKLLSQRDKKLRRGELIILEEGGVNLGSLDFQSKVSKMFTYVLQSFRSMNVALIFNLPVLTMLNKSARLLLHSNFITAGIDHKKKVCKVKPFFHQLNQQTGKVYPKYMIMKHNGRQKKVRRFIYSLPNEKTIKLYEDKKFRFVSSLNNSFLDELHKKEQLEQLKLARKELTPVQKEFYDDWVEGLSIKESAKKREKDYSCCWEARQRIKKKGYGVKIKEKPKEMA